MEFGYDIAKSFWNWYNFFPRNDGINKYIPICPEIIFGYTVMTALQGVYKSKWLV